MTRRAKPPAEHSSDAVPTPPAESVGSRPEAPPAPTAPLAPTAAPAPAGPVPPTPDALAVLAEPTIEDRAGREPGELVPGMSPRQIIGGFAVLAGLIILLRRRGRRRG